MRWFVKNYKLKFKIAYWTLFFFGLLFISFFTPSFAKAATLYVSPASGSYKVGDTINATVYVNSDQAMNAAEGVISYPSDLLEFQSVSSSGSIFSFWTRGPNGGDSSTTFGGGLANPGYTGGSGKILTLTWKAKSTGTANISVSGVRILANDGVGTNIASGAGGASFTISDGGSAPVTPSTPSRSSEPARPTVTLPRISSESHPDQGRWYSNRDVKISWTGGTGVVGYLYEFDQNPSTVPNGAAVTIKEKIFTGTTEGIWYFHLRGKTDKDFLSVTHYKVMIDASPPSTFEVKVDQPGGKTNPRPIVTFETADNLSGIDKYEMRVDGGEYKPATSGTQLEKLRPGNHTVKVKVTDKAGNSIEVQTNFAIEGITAPVIIDWTKTALIFDPAVIIGYAQPTDKIIVFLDEKEIASFMVSDNLLEKQEKLLVGEYKLTDDKAGVAWQYVYKDFLLPGDRNFSFMRVDKNEAESNISQVVTIKIEAAALRLFGRVVLLRQIIAFLITMIVLLVAILIFLWCNIKSISEIMGIKKFPQLGIVKFLGRMRYKIEQKIPNRKLSQEEVRAIKEELEEEIDQMEELITKK